MSAIDTSSISFTALYTGQVWVANGLSSPAFSSGKGRLFYYSLLPFECMGKYLLGSNVESFLLQRHLLLDHLLHQAIADQGVTQVLEVAAGLSPRGFRFCEQYPRVTYVEGDLPEMASRKRNLLAKHNLRMDHHPVVDLNIFSESGNDTLEAVVERYFDTSKPLVVISEGLVNYFSRDVMKVFWSRLQHLLSRFARGTYLTDTYLPPRRFILQQASRWYMRVLRAWSRSGVSFHFETNHQAVHYFKNLDFSDVKVHCPQSYYHELPMPVSKTEPFVRIVEASTGA